MDNSINLAKKQHYVPKFYLKEFATNETYGKKDKAQVHIYDVEKEDFYIRNIKTIAYEKYLYSPLDKDGLRSSYMEDKLASLESYLSKIWKDIGNKNSYFSDSYKKSIALYIATLVLRHPFHYKDTQNFRDTLTDDILKNIPNGDTKFSFIHKGKESIINVEELHQAKNESSYDKKMFFINKIEQSSQKIADLLIKKKWLIITSEEKIFITSDNPVVISNPKTGLLGINAEGVIIILPLSPTRILYLEDNPNNKTEVMYHPLKKGRSSYFNHPSFSNAYKYVISHREFKEVIPELWEERKPLISI